MINSTEKMLYKNESDLPHCASQQGGWGGKAMLRVTFGQNLSRS